MKDFNNLIPEDWQFNIIKAPINIKRVLGDKFEDWLILGSLKDLECTLKAFEGAEMYEDCRTILSIINQKKDESQD